MRKVILVAVAVLALAQPASAQQLTRPQARAALQAFVDRYPEIDTTRIDRCKWRPTRRLWTCRLHLAGTSPDGFAVDGATEPSRFEARWRYRISGSCRSARVELAEPFLTEPARRFNVCAAKSN